jgi:hypothetical protein
VTALLATFVGCQSVWQGPPRRLDFANLEQASRLQVCGRVCPLEEVATISDPEQIRYATAFIEKYSGDWRDSWNGSPGGTLNLYFYQGDRVLGGYGMTPSDAADVLVSVGNLSRRVPATEIDLL